MPTSRREFLSTRLLGALATVGLAELLWSRELLAAEAGPTIEAWFAELAELTRALRGGRLRDVEFQTRVDALQGRVDLEGLIARVELDALAGRLSLPERGAASVKVELAGLAGVKGLEFGRRVFACRAGRSIVPHGHTNMCTGFIVLRGRWRGRHYERIETHPDHCVIAPTIDREFGPGEGSTISDHRDNVHWFQAVSEGALVFNWHVAGSDPRSREAPGRMYLDPDGERGPGGTIRARRVTAAACLRKYG